MKRQHSRLCKGFTLVEMLVVIGMIGVLAATLISSFSHVKTTARQAQAQSQVSEVATAFNLYLQQTRDWPKDWASRGPEQMKLDKKACAVFQKAGLLDLTTWKTLPSVSPEGVVGDDGSLNPDSPDRFGMSDPWGRAAIRRNPKITESAVIEGGSKLSEHLIQFRLDLDFDGYVDAGEGSPKGVKVRSSVLVWSRGPDGKDAAAQAGRYPDDDRLSWNYGQSRGSK